MDIDTILTAITTIGFPIVCVLICFYYIYTRDKAHQEEESALRETHHEEIISILDEQRTENNKLVEAINNNTIVINKLIERMDS